MSGASNVCALCGRSVRSKRMLRTLIAPEKFLTMLPAGRDEWITLQPGERVCRHHESACDGLFPLPINKLLTLEQEVP